MVHTEKTRSNNCFRKQNAAERVQSYGYRSGQLFYHQNRSTTNKCDRPNQRSGVCSRP